jgi:hypothetical protein
MRGKQAKENEWGTEMSKKDTHLVCLAKVRRISPSAPSFCASTKLANNLD